MLPAVIGVLAAIWLFVVAQDAFEVMLLPRRVQRELRIVRLFYRATWGAYAWAARRLPQGAVRERVLSVFGPLSVMTLFTLWASGFMLGYAALYWSLTPVPATGQAPGIPSMLYLSGATFFTLGYGDVVPVTGPTRLLSIMEAASGLTLVAMVISYLPVLYQLFSRREAHVILLDGRAGSPPTASRMLLLHATPGGGTQLDVLMRDWEIWAAELLESHLSYPMLAFYRSQHDNQSWLAAVTAIMDACALVLVGSEGISLLQARMTFAMLRQSLVEMTRSFGIPLTRVAGPDRLDHAGFERLDALLREGGSAWQGGVHSEELLATLRTTYEPLLAGLSRYLLLPLPTWLAAQGSADHWDQGTRGTLARRLVEELTARNPAPDPSADDRLWRRLRQRLRPPS